MSARPLLHIGRVVRNAQVFDFRNLGAGAMSTDALLQTVSRLFDLLHERQIDYLLAGGIAMLHYVEGRNTEDIDLIIALADVQKMPEIHIESQDENFARGKYGALQIDFLLTRNPLFARVHQQYATVRPFRERDIPCATVEGLLLLKLYALPSLYRQGNFARVGLYENDIATLVHAYRPDLEPLFAELVPHLLGSDLKELRAIVAEIQQRIERFHHRSGKSLSK